MRTNTIRVGPFPVFFGNVNEEMGLRGHYHHATITLVYGYTSGDHGYPVFKDTNDAIRRELQHFTKGIFRNATNEVVLERLFDHFAGFFPPEWHQWGGAYWLNSAELAINGVWDDIGHDAGVGVYTTSVVVDTGTDTRTMLGGVL